jgi:hypothetical protein
LKLGPRLPGLCEASAHNDAGTDTGYDGITNYIECSTRRYGYDGQINVARNITKRPIGKNPIDIRTCWGDGNDLARKVAEVAPYDIAR